MVDSKIKKATVSAAKKNITASGVRIENGTFVDDEGSIVEIVLLRSYQKVQLSLILKSVLRFQMKSLSLLNRE